jgi:hypothetical protein
LNTCLTHRSAYAFEGNWMPPLSPAEVSFVWFSFSRVPFSGLFVA